MKPPMLPKVPVPFPTIFNVAGYNVFTLGSERYCIIPGNDDSTPIFDGFHNRLVNVVPFQPSVEASPTWFQDYVERVIHKDDFSDAFSRAIVFAKRDTDAKASLGALQKILYQQDIWQTIWTIPTKYTRLSAGPHIILRERLYQVYKLCEDTHCEFMTPVVQPDDDGLFRKFTVAGQQAQGFSIAVPSRQALLYKHKGPLAGMRIAVKDIFDLKGITRTACNRAYASVSSPAEETSPAVQRLLDSGASILGTLKMNALLAPDEPTDAVDYLAPFNPRGDGYQTPSGSSSGSAGAIAAYDWLDFTIGSDTTASSRKPALACGCYQIRFTHGAIPAAGIMENFSRFDESALFGRDLETLAACASEFAEPSKMHSRHKTPKSIIYLQEYLPIQDKLQDNILNQFIADLARSGSLAIRKLSLAQVWTKTPPGEAAGKTLFEYLQNVGHNTFYYDFYHNTVPFRDRYRSKFNAFPFVNKVVRWRWEFAAKISKEDRDEGIRRLDVYKQWLLEHVLREESESAIVVLPIGKVQPTYRDHPTGSGYFIWDAWDPLWLSPILEGPELSVPIGEVPYMSEISRRTEKLPVVASLLGAPGIWDDLLLPFDQSDVLTGSESMLMNTAMTCFKNSDRPLRVFTGREMFKQGP